MYAQENDEFIMFSLDILVLIEDMEDLYDETDSGVSLMFV